ncbi:MAG: STAS domain-containing protein [Proteobacteria bacterium]|nr:STAS domain-containing protein [Pseudomonadota bacterium]
MTTRKQQTPAKKRAQRRPTKRGSARGRPAVVRGKPAGAGPSALTLAAECTVAEADALQSQLARRLQEPGAVTVDVSALQRIDTAGLQLLAAFVRDRRTAGRAVKWRGRAAALDSAASLLGVNDMLERAGEVGR